MVNMTDWDLGLVVAAGCIMGAAFAAGSVGFPAGYNHSAQEPGTSAYWLVLLAGKQPHVCEEAGYNHNKVMKP
jgi:hypothetical protein